MLAFHETLQQRRWLKTLISHGPRVLIEVVLVTAFFYFFGVPAIERFAKKGVIIVETTKDTKGIPIPAITLAVEDQITIHTCFHKNASIENCIVENTLKSSDILKSLNFGFYHNSTQQFNLTDGIVREDFLHPWGGRYYTINLPLKIGPTSRTQLYLGLNTNLTYTIFFHDSEYFLPNANPNGLPTLMRKFRTSMERPKSWYYKLELTEVNNVHCEHAKSSN